MPRALTLYFYLYVDMDYYTYTVVQNQKAVSVHLWSKQIFPFGFARETMWIQSIYTAVTTVFNQPD